MEAGLYVIGTPIGNLGDLTRRAAETLPEMDVVYAEDTRRTGRLLESLGTDVPLRSLHEHNEARRVEEITDRLADGERVGLVTDAGTPAVSDPGRRAVAEALEAGHRVSPVPGASAVTTALSVSGLEADRFVFLGFPPRKGADREECLRMIAELPLTSVLFESPRRVGELLSQLGERGLGGRRGALCREMTKKFEEIRAGTVADLREWARGREIRGEVTLVLEGGDEARNAVPADAVREAARELLSAGRSTRDVSEHLQRAYGLSRNEAYELALELDGDA